jgi:hypothetical protein
MLRTEEEIEKRILSVNEQLQAIDNLPPGIQPFLREQDYKDLAWKLRYEQRILEWVLCKGE